MTESFFTRPILNSPYAYPARHWELEEGQPTGLVIEKRRRAEFITPIPKPKRRREEQKDLVFDEGAGISDERQQYELTASMINELRVQVDRWRALPNPSQWNVTPETARLLEHWRHHEFSTFRPFFCQVEAVETLIWLSEVAPKVKEGKKFLQHLEQANDQANPGLPRLALKLATGAGKTTVMAMTIAWQTINAVRHPNAKRFTRGFLIVTPGITIKDRLRVLQPNDPDAYYQSRELVPSDMLRDLGRAKIVITNYHAFKLRETVQLASGTRALLKGRGGEELQTLETEGQMLQRVMPELMGMKNVMVLNDEAHHCYREKPGEDEEEDLKGDDRKEAEKNKEAARLWIMIERIPKPFWARPKIAQTRCTTKDIDIGQSDLANVQNMSKSSKPRERRMKKELRPTSQARPAPSSAPQGRQRVARGKRSAAPVNGTSTPPREPRQGGIS